MKKALETVPVGSPLLVPIGLGVFIFPQFAGSPAFPIGPVPCREVPSRLPAPGLLKGGTDFRGRQISAGEFPDTGQGGGMRAGSQENGPVLQQGAPVPPLGAADYLASSQEQV